MKQDFFHICICHTPVHMYDGLGYLMADHISLFVDIHQTAECQSVHPFIQGTDTIGKGMGQHRNHLIDQIDAGASLQCLFVKGRSLLDIMRHICNMHPQKIMAILHLKSNRIIQILGIFSINGHGHPISQISAPFSLFRADRFRNR